MRNFMKPFLILFCTLLSFFVYSQKKRSIRFLDFYEIPYNTSFQNTTIGGLSGIDYDSKHDIYYVISDDRGTINAPHFYTLQIKIKDQQIDTLVFQNVSFLLDETGNIYKSPRPDPESIRYHSVEESLFWSSEGERILSATDTFFSDPFIKVQKKDGSFVKQIALPSSLKMELLSGPRQNGSIESIDFDSEYKNLFFALEEPLIEDGERADTANQALSRIYQIDLYNPNISSIYAYPLDPIAYSPIPKNSYKINGIVDILHIEEETLWLTERSYSNGIRGCIIKIFQIQLDKNKETKTLKDLPTNKILTKTLLYDFRTTGIFIENIEGATIGKPMNNGNKTLLFVSDNNFLENIPTQFFLFEMIEE